MRDARVEAGLRVFKRARQRFSIARRFTPDEIVASASAHELERWAQELPDDIEFLYAVLTEIDVKLAEAVS